MTDPRALAKTNVRRRAFVQTLLFLPCGVFLLRCSGSDGSNNSGGPSGSSEGDTPAAGPIVSGSQAVYTSSDNGAHHHTFAIELAELASPPSDGVGGPTSENDAHVHTVSVSMKELQNVQAGQSVLVTTSSNSGHTHTFTFVKVAASE